MKRVHPIAGFIGFLTILYSCACGHLCIVSRSVRLRCYFRRRYVRAGQDLLDRPQSFRTQLRLHFATN